MNYCTDQQLLLTAHFTNLIKFNLSKGTKRKTEVKIRFYSLSEAASVITPNLGFILYFMLVRG